MAEEVITRSADPVKVKLIKGQRDSYSWEISVQGDNMTKILAEVYELDVKLRIKFRGEEVK